MMRQGHDSIFPAFLSDAFKAALTKVGGSVSPIGQGVQNKNLVAHWEVDSPGTLDLDYSLGVPVATAWRDKLFGVTLTAPTLTQAPMFITHGGMVSERPALSFDGLDDFMENLSLDSTFNNLSGLTASLLVSNSPSNPNTIERMLWIESGAAGVPRFGYARSGIAPDQFYMDGVTRDNDPYVPVTGSVYPYDGWATHTMRRDYVMGTARLDFNGGPKATGTGIQTMNYGDSSSSLRLRLGAENLGNNPGQFYIYGLKLYTYAIDDDAMLADAAYFGGRLNA